MQIQESPGVFVAQQQFFSSGITRSHAFRKEQLRKLKAAIKANETAITQALRQDLRKPALETYATEIGPVYSEIDHTLKHLKNWMQPVRVSTPLYFFPSSSRIYRDSVGVVLIIAPWNYPFNLSLAPLVAAIAGGNTAIIKPSEFSPATTLIIQQLIQQTFNSDYITVLSGAGETVLPPLIEQHAFGHIFYTGSTAVGRKIMQMASRQLTPVTLELGGKTPCIIDKDVNLSYAIKKIAWSKFVNAGQTCVAPDYVLVHRSLKDAFASGMKEQLVKMFGTDAQQSPDYARIINEARFDKLAAYLNEGKISVGGSSDKKDLYIAPTLLDEVILTDMVMREEIFGPVLPILCFDQLEDTLPIIAENPNPLALYVYTNKKSTEQFYISRVAFGGGCINNGLIHLGNPDLPFGGVGFSGMGQYHGKHGFDLFTRPKSVLRSATWFDTPVWYPPYGNNLRWLKKILK